MQSLLKSSRTRLRDLFRSRRTLPATGKGTSLRIVVHVSLGGVIVNQLPQSEPSFIKHVIIHLSLTKEERDNKAQKAFAESRDLHPSSLKEDGSRLGGGGGFPIIISLCLPISSLYMQPTVSPSFLTSSQTILILISILIGALLIRIIFQTFSPAPKAPKMVNLNQASPGP